MLADPALIALSTVAASRFSLPALAAACRADSSRLRIRRRHVKLSMSHYTIDNAKY
jgi:hypothetical protein